MISNWPVGEEAGKDGVYLMFEGALHRAPVVAEKWHYVVRAIVSAADTSDGSPGEQYGQHSEPGQPRR